MDWELIFWIVAGIASIISFWILFTRPSDYVEWIERGEWQ